MTKQCGCYIEGGTSQPSYTRHNDDMDIVFCKNHARLDDALEILRMWDNDEARTYDGFKHVMTATRDLLESLT